jgi:hypothetical protein
MKGQREVRRFLVAAALSAVVWAAAACGGASRTVAPTGTPTVPATTITPVPTTATVVVPVPPTASATPMPPSGRIFERAPIDKVEMIVRETAPPQYAARVLSGLPSGCHEFAGATVSRSHTEITITVRNSRPADPRTVCTQIYGTHEEIVELGSDFVRGTEYRVHVNERTIAFTAR